MNLFTPVAAKIRVLVAQGDPAVARDTCQQLTDLGYDPVAQAPSGEAAIALVERLHPDLALIGMTLTGRMNGTTTAHTLQQRFAMPVVLLTTPYGRELAPAAKDCTPFDCLNQPFHAQELRTVIELAFLRQRTDVLYRTFTESTPDAIVTVDSVGNISGWNRGATQIFGHTEAEILGRHMSLVIEEFSRVVNPPWSGRTATGEEAPSGNRVVELTGHRRDGREFPIELSLARWHTSADHFVTAIIRDISSRKRADEQMRLQGAALEATVNSVVITDPLGTIEWVNPAFCRITGYEKTEVIGQNPRVLKSGRQSLEYYAEMWRTVSAGRSWSGEFVNCRKDGTPYTESVTITPVKDETGKIAHYIAIKQDISALKKSLAELESAHAELEAKNRALDAALVDSHAALDAKATFLATMSHEIRTPMNGVIGMASLLRETAPLTAEQQDYIETIRSSGETLLTIINDVLDFSKIESGHLELEKVPIELQRCLEETLENIAPRAREKRLDLALQIDDSVPTAIIGDPVRLRQVLTNLAANAVKFTERGEVVIEVRADPAADGSLRIFFGVRDTGIGIPPDKIDRLFKAFSQVDSSTTRLYGGTGLGLAISQRLVGLMGGVIAVRSVPGVGSTFHFDFPTAAAPTPEPEAAPQWTVELKDRRILIVDDNATNRQIFSTQLRHAGLVPEEADSGAAALALLRSQRWPSAIITDMLMPNMDGMDFSLAVRALEAAHPEQPPLPIILVSSGGYQSSDPRTKLARLHAALSKPLRRAQLIDTVSRALAQAPQRRSAAPTSLASIADSRELARQQPCRILLAEDNAVNRKVALALLTRIGYAADVAVDGLAAVDACRQHDYDLVLMDVQMPELDGLEATRRVRLLAGHRPTIIAMTANAMEGDREKCLAAGMDDYVSKPIKIEDLKRVVAFARALQVPA